MTHGLAVATTSPIEIACCFDANMLIGAEMMIASVARSSSGDRPIIIHVVTHSSDPMDLARLHAATGPNMTIVPHEVSSLPFPLPQLGPALTETCYYRFLLADILRDCDKVLYLDCDLMVRRDVAALFDIEIDDRLLAAVQDLTLTHVSNGWSFAFGDENLSSSRYAELLGATAKEDYFNTGVLLLNLKRWRDEGLTGQLSTFVVRNPTRTFPDQDALNAIVKSRYRKLDVRWNVLGFALQRNPLIPNDMPGSPEMLDLVRRDPWIVHFAGPRKPWHPDPPVTLHDAEMRTLLPTTQPSMQRSLARQPTRGPAPANGGAIVLSPTRKGGLPLVSVVVVNYNYAPFLWPCVESIALQDYPAVECVVIDNASTDGSEKVLQAIDGFADRVSIVRSPSNLGQGGACALGLRHTTGTFVMFVDADDYLLPQAITYHVHTHLALKRSTGFTSSDMIQIVDDRLIVGTYFEATHGRPARSCTPINTPSLNDVAAMSRDARRVFEGLPPVPLQEVAAKNTAWVWSPTSANMYRREALDLFAGIEALNSFRINSDAFFNYAVHSFVGSVLIEKPLSAYRFHRRNSFARGVSLANFSASHTADDSGSRAAHLILEHVIANFADFQRKMLSTDNLLTAMATLQRKARLHPLRGRPLKRAYFVLRRAMIAAQSRALRKYFEVRPR